MNLLVKFLVVGQCLLPLVLAANIGGGQSASGHESVIRIDDYQSQNRLKRYALLDFKWPMNELTYKILNYPRKFRASTDERYKVDKVIKRAFESWAEVSTLSFSRIKSNAGKANINIRFSSRHINNDTLAKHVPPTNETLISYIDFNDNKDWTVVGSTDTSLFSAALHVIGHVLGVDHSLERKAIMFPLNNGVHHLHSDDIKAIRMLYGHQRTKRQAFSNGFRWPMTNLTYRIINYPSKFGSDRGDIDRVFKEAFGMWANVSKLDFHQIDSNAWDANISIKFMDDKHGCQLDCMGTWLISRTVPTNSENLKSYIHFNNIHKWSKDRLLSNGLHEIGHSLGLAHSNNQEAKMFHLPNVSPNLHEDDIRAIRLLYGQQL